ncbi:hypothetical protein [Pararhizobium sp. PWRC1-1]|uniref:hypothetical protein n=1 Tax=Pararhizobium sp. PWRC1-1 TaxID=2804566 RepID=UPI003CF09DD6
MSNERPDHYMMIGLHKLAAQSGDGLVPELHELMSRRARMVEDNPNVTEFPAWQARPPARSALGLAPEPRDNILPFVPGAAATVQTKDQA